MFGLPFLGGGDLLLPLFIGLFLGLNSIIRALFPDIFSALTPAAPM